MAATILFRTTPRIILGNGAIEQIGAEVKNLKGKRTFVVTDPGIVQSGILEKVTEILKTSRLSFGVFNKVESDPRIEIVDQALAELQEGKYDSVIGIGGGSSLDIAKLTSVMAKNPGKISDYFGIDLVPNPGLPLILVPTTAGTGSEVTPIAILSDEAEHLKKGVVSGYLFPKVALLDPLLTLGLPPGVTAATGMDALIHAIEAYTSINANDLTDHFAFKAMQLIYANIRTAYARGEDVTARFNMLEGSLIAGLAFANAGVTAVHAFAYPLGGEFHVPHGLANAVMLPHVLRFNLLGNLAKFALISKAFGLPVDHLSLKQAAEAGISAIEELMRDLNIPLHLKDMNVSQEAIPRMAEGVMKVTRLLANNPRKMTLKDAVEIYQRAW
jgi:alcohol dehydrogenase class IV